MILFKYASRSRPDSFLNTIRAHYNQMSGNIPFKFVISCDADDQSMNTPEMCDYVASLPHAQIHLNQPPMTKITAINANLENENFDILVIVSDNMMPQIRGFDQIIDADMQNHFPDGFGALHYFDGRHHDICKNPIIGRKLYDYFGYVYHPAYKSCFAAREFTQVVQGMKKLRYIHQNLIADISPVEPDDLRKQNTSASRFFADHETFVARSAASFPKN